MAAVELKTYTNPVYNHSFPDPFVLRSGNAFFAFCTGYAGDGRVFGMATSDDLVNWRELPGAMEPLRPGVAAGDLYWAPEVTFFDGMHYMYYSVGNETRMEIRVATSVNPDGPFVDAGHKLTDQDFAIDPHVFIDDDGSWHMFYATDFLEHSRIGTGTVVDRMLDKFTLAGQPRPVTRARYDWQVYDPARKEKGGVRWHTVEGPFVLKRKGRYFEMFSGGNWQNISYGVGYAVSGSLEAEDEWTQMTDGRETLPLLHTVPHKVIGPGHNSVVQGPNGRELFCVYHRWENDKRVMCIDRMDHCGGDRLFVVGPTFEPQPAPFDRKSDGFEETFKDSDVAARGWSVTDDCGEFADGCLLLISGGAPASLGRGAPHGDLEFAANFRLDDLAVGRSSISFHCGIGAMISESAKGWRMTAGTREMGLPEGFRPDIFHQYRAVGIGGHWTIYIDGSEIGTVSESWKENNIELIVHHATAVLDMVRFTRL